MVSDKTEEEQIEALKKWFEENGTSLIVGIVLALGGVFGYQTWQSSVRETGEEASALYQDLVDTVAVSPMEQMGEDQLSTAQFLADQLKTDYEDTTYAHFAAMFMARVAAEGNDLETAASELRWLLEQGPEESIELIVRPRLARVLLAQGNPEEALQVIDGRDPGAHQSTWEEVRGDILVQLDRKEEAREAYQTAMDTMIDRTNKPVLEMKLGDIAKPETVIPDRSLDTDAGEAETTTGTGDQ